MPEVDTPLPGLHGFRRRQFPPVAAAVPPPAPAPEQGTLTVHMPGSHRVTLGQLRTLPPPPSLGRHHKPVPHYQLVETVEEQIEARGWEVRRTQLAVNKNAQMVFGVLDLVKLRDKVRDDDLAVGPDSSEMGTTFGFRNSVNQSFGLRGVAGGRVWICDNLCLSGAEFVLQQKNTLRMNLAERVSVAIDKFIEQSRQLIDDIEALKQRPMADYAAKSLLYDVFSTGALPLHLLDDVNGFYFRPQEQHTDCQPRSAWGLHNACTRGAGLLKDTQRFHSSMALGRVFDLAKTAPSIY